MSLSGLADAWWHWLGAVRETRSQGLHPACGAHGHKDTSSSPVPDGLAWEAAVHLADPLLASCFPFLPLEVQAWKDGISHLGSHIPVWSKEVTRIHVRGESCDLGSSPSSFCKDVLWAYLN